MINNIALDCGQMKKKSKEEMTIENRGMKILSKIQTINFNKAAKKQAYEARLRAKVQNGDRLTGEELYYIRTNMPDLYQKALRMMGKRQAVEQACKNCKSKEELDTVLAAQMLAVSENDPDREMMNHVIQKVMAEFKSSRAYQSLIETEQKDIGKDNINNASQVSKETEYKIELGSYQELYEKEEREKFYAIS